MASLAERSTLYEYIIHTSTSIVRTLAHGCPASRRRKTYASTFDISQCPYVCTLRYKELTCPLGVAMKSWASLSETSGLCRTFSMSGTELVTPPKRGFSDCPSTIGDLGWFLWYTAILLVAPTTGDLLHCRRQAVCAACRPTLTSGIECSKKCNSTAVITR